jgi:serine/threonine protein kinase
MDAQKFCQNCQAPLAANAPRGLCPACLMKVALATGTAAGQEKPGFTPPGIEELARKFPQLEIIELIGRGGMGAVYKARQKELDRIVALKILPPGIGDDAAFAERFAREAKALAKLNHPGIVTIHDFGRADGLYFFVMEFVDGVNLRQLLASGRVSPREALAIVPQICDALQFAHDQGIVHRDIKPENILLDRRGRVKVADFGLAKLAGTGSEPAGTEDTAGFSTLTDAGKVMGTPPYMAPEQREHPGEVDHRADIYALGVVFYQMLAGELPGKSLEPPSRKVRLDVRLDEVVLRALEQEPERRYQQVSEVKTMLETIAATPDKTVPSIPADAPLPARMSSGWKRAIVGGLGLIALLTVLCLMALIIGSKGKQTPTIAATNLSESDVQTLLAWKQKKETLQKLFEERPGKRIPEMQLLSKEQWLDIAKDRDLQSETGIRQAMKQLRKAATSDFAAIAVPAVEKYVNDNAGQVPTNVSQLRPYFKMPVDDAILQRYAILPAAAVDMKISPAVKWVIAEKAPVDPDYDERLTIRGERWGWGWSYGSYELPAQPAADHPTNYPATRVGRRQDLDHFARNKETLQKLFEERPGQRIPEMQLLSEEQWLDIAKDRDLQSETGIRQAMSQLRKAAKRDFAAIAGPAVVKYEDGNARQVPTNVSQLRPYFKMPVDDAILQRYAILPAAADMKFSPAVKWVIAEKAPVDPDYDERLTIGGGGWGYGSYELSAAPATNHPTNYPATRAGRWQEDLDCFAREFPVRQIDFARLMPRDRFEREVTNLKRQVPELSDQEIVFQLMRIVASFGVAHTSIAFGSIRETVAPDSYPIEMQWFSDGLAVVATSPQYQQALGCRVARIGSKTPEQVEAALAPYIATENGAHLHAESPRFMTLMGLMQHEKLVEPSGGLRLTCTKPGGGELRVEIAPVNSFQSRPKLVSAANVLHIPGRLCDQHPKAFYWYEYLDETHTLYIAYNQCMNDPNKPFEDLARDLFAVADSRPVERVIVDLRFNGGGSSSVIKPLVDGLMSRTNLTARGHLYTLIGSRTFSSGLMAAMDFRSDLHAILIGEPTGNKPNHCGQQEDFSLPNSTLLVHYATKHFHLMQDADPSTLAPDITVPSTLDDFLAGRDPVLEAALHHSFQ